MKICFIIIAIFINVAIITSCRNNDGLPYLGRKTAATKIVAGRPITDSVYPVIDSFRVQASDGQFIANDYFKGKIYIADFIFLSCPTICPVMTAHLRQIYDKYKNDPSVLFISYTIDPAHDTLPRLSAYVTKMGIDQHKWIFARSEHEEAIIKLATHSFYATAMKDTSANGGYVHSGGIFLVDSKGHLRGVYDGTSPEVIARLSRDIAILKQKG